MRSRTMAIGQGVFYLATGIWPILSIRTFEKVTGPKEDEWLVKTIGAMIAVSGASFLRAGLRSRVPRDIALLAAGEALVLGSSSLIYSSIRRISRIYLLDTSVEYALALAWARAAGSEKGQERIAA